MYDVLNTFYCNVQEGKSSRKRTRKDKLRKVISAILPKLNQGRGDENASSVEDGYSPFCHIYRCKFALRWTSLFSKRRIQE